MKIIVGVIASPGEYYDQAEIIWRSYMNCNSNVKSYFIKTDKTDAILENDVNTFVCKNTNESIDNLLKKTIHFMKWALESDLEWSYLLRTNLSSLFHWENVLKTLNENSEYDIIASKENYGTISFPSGCGMFLSRKLVKEICYISETLLTLKNYNDDVVLGIAITQLGYNYNNWKNIRYNHITNDTNLETKSMHLRCKIENTDMNTRKTKEIPMMYKWIRYWYP